MNTQQMRRAYTRCWQHLAAAAYCLVVAWVTLAWLSPALQWVAFGTAVSAVVNAVSAVYFGVRILRELRRRQ